MLTGSNTGLFLAIFTLSFLLSSCGNEGSDDDILQEQTQDQRGTFVTVLGPLNGGASLGQANFVVGQDDFTADITMEGLSNGVTIRQYLLSGNRCPQTSAALPEALAVSGPILIPLDNDLSGQYVGGQYPQADASGAYTYQARANLEDMITDLRDPDPDERDNLRKLSPDELLNMEGRTVIVTEVQGINEVPIACGVVTR